MEGEGLAFRFSSGRRPRRCGQAISMQTEGIDMFAIDDGKCMRDVVLDEPLFGDFLVDKGFPFSIENPITELVTFEDVVQMHQLDRRAFLAEYEDYKARGGALAPGAGKAVDAPF